MLNRLQTSASEPKLTTALVLPDASLVQGELLGKRAAQSMQMREDDACARAGSVAARMRRRDPRCLACFSKTGILRRGEHRRGRSSCENCRARNRQSLAHSAMLNRGVQRGKSLSPPRSLQTLPSNRECGEQPVTAHLCTRLYYSQTFSGVFVEQENSANAWWHR